MKMKQIAALLAALMLVMAASVASALTVTGYDSDSSGREWATSKFFARMEELTGVAVEAKAVTEQKDYDKLLKSMASGNVTADVLFKAELSRSKERELLDAGAIIDLAPMIEENMPNLSALLAAHPEWREIITLEDGRRTVELITAIYRSQRDKKPVRFPLQPEYGSDMDGRIR